MRKYLFLLVTLSPLATAQSLVRGFPDRVLRFEVVQFKPVAGHHFSMEAPQDCGGGQVVDKAPMALKCQFVTSGSTQATLNVCDDKKTYCKPNKLTINVVDRTAPDATALSRNEKNNIELKHKLVPGFVSDKPGAILAQARERKQPVFVMISTDWCPPCNEAKEYLLSSTAFQQASANWFKVYVDGDSLGAAEWDRAVPFKYFPSFVLLNSDLREIARFTGELRQKDFADWAEDQKRFMMDPVSDLQDRVLARRSGSLVRRLKDLLHGVDIARTHKEEERLLKWAFDTENRVLAKTLLEGREFPGLLQESLKFQIGELERAENLGLNKDPKGEKLKLYDRLLESTFQGEHWAENLQGLCETDVDACKKFLDRISARLKFLEDQPGLLEQEKQSRLGDEYFYLTQVYQTTGDKNTLKAFGEKCAAHFEAMRNKSLLKISRASQQGMVACLELAGDFKRETDVLKTLVEAYPNEPTFVLRMGRMFRKQKRPVEALHWMEKAETLAYGYNWFSLRLMKAEVLMELKKGAEAKKVIAETLAQVPLGGDQDSREQSLVARLRGLEQKAQDMVLAGQ